FNILKELCSIYSNPSPQIGPCKISNKLGNREYKDNISCRVFDRICHVIRYIFTCLYLAGNNTKCNTDDAEEKEYERHNTGQEWRRYNRTSLASQRAVR